MGQTEPGMADQRTTAQRHDSARQPPVLVVDLDGTLLRSDMLFECFWSACGRDWRAPFAALAALGQGRAALKQHLAAAARVDVATLPYEPLVLTEVQRWRDGGGRTALVTASDHRLAMAIAAHLGLFDDVQGSDDGRNLKGEHKGRYLEERFGAGGFAYMGDAAADVAVWRRAGQAITVNAAARVRRAAEAACADTRHLGGRAAGLEPWARVLRPHQWLKNLLVLLPMLAAHQLDLPTLLHALLAFFSFSFIASSVYVLNDLLDLAADRTHPRKSARPFAAGSVPIAHGGPLAAALLLAGLGGAAILGTAFLAVMLGYFLLTSAYSLVLKRRIVIDICVLAGLYTLRIIAGGVATGIPLSVWLLAFSLFFFLALAAVKRQAELIDSAARGKLTASGRGYHVEDLPIISMIGLGAGYVSVLVAALYVNSPAVVERYRTPEALWGVCVVLLFWVTRTVLVTHRGQMHDDPVVFAARDGTSRLCLLIILALLLVGALA